MKRPTMEQALALARLWSTRECKPRMLATLRDRGWVEPAPLPTTTKKAGELVIVSRSLNGDDPFPTVEGIMALIAYLVWATDRELHLADRLLAKRRRAQQRRERQ